MNDARTKTFIKTVRQKQYAWLIRVSSSPDAAKHAAVVGREFDYLVLATTWGVKIENTVAAIVIHNPLMMRDHWFNSLWKDLQSQWPVHITLPDETLIKYTVVLAWIEGIYRSGHLATGLEEAKQQNLNLTDLVTTIPACVIQDLQNLLDYSQITRGIEWKGRRVEENPDFAGSHDVGGADADWIVDQTLWDMKTTKYPAQSWHNDIKQILVYALLDYADEYHIEQVGLYYPRFGTTLQWPVTELLKELPGEEYSMEKWREIFQNFISNA